MRKPHSVAAGTLQPAAVNPLLPPQPHCWLQQALQHPIVVECCPCSCAAVVYTQEAVAAGCCSCTGQPSPQDLGDDAGAVGPGAEQRVATHQLQRDDIVVVLTLQAEDQHPQKHQ